MERRVIVMRHAKSSWADEGLPDHERPLNDRGRRDAPSVGERLAKLGWVPEVVRASDARRTRETWALMARAFDPEPSVAYTSTLYLAGVDAAREVLEALPAAVGTVLLLGHNDGWEQVVSWLSDEDVRLKTASAALLSSEGDTWELALANAPCWRLHEVVRPK